MDKAMTPPNAVDLEQIVLGSILSDKDCYIFVADILSQDVFYLEKNKMIYQALETISERGEPIDLLTAAEQLKKDGNLESVGGYHYLTGLTGRVVSTANIEYHARIIIQKHMQREMIRLSDQTKKDCYNDTVDIFDIIDSYETKRDELINTVIVKRESSNGEVVSMTVSEIIDNAGKGAAHLIGIPTGSKKIDEVTGGWQNSNLIILAARPAMGKTALMLKFVTSAAKEGFPVAAFSLEMSNSDLVKRIISKETRIDGSKITKNRLNPEDLEAIKYSSKNISDLPIFWDDTAGASITEIVAKARRLKRLHDIKMIVIDYLQLISGKKGVNREQEISGISRSLKILAKDLNIPVIALSQLSRALESRPGNSKRPMLSDLRESGAIEQDADVVAFIYRAEYYDIMENEVGESTEGVAEVIFSKNRNGMKDTVELKFEPQFMNFEDIDDDFFSASPNNDNLNNHAHYERDEGSFWDNDSPF